MTFNIGKSLILLLLLLLFVATFFITSDYFVDSKLTPKWYLFVLIANIGGIFTVFFQRDEINLSRSVILLMLFVFYSLLSSWPNKIPILEISISLSCISLSVFLNANSSFSRSINLLILISSIILACYSLLQYAGILPTDEGFKMLGGYGNPAGLSANLAFTLPLIFMFTDKNKYLSAGYILLIVLTTCLSESRAGVISILAVGVIYLFTNFPKRLANFKLLTMSSIGILVAAFLVYLYYFKENSAVGRTLIWKVAIQLVSDNPFFGGGSYAFLRTYMMNQADYFVSHSDNRYEMIAGNVMHTFNEYLMILVRYGITGFFVLGGSLLWVIKNESIRSPYILCIISIAIFSLFSYPFQYPITWFILIYCVVQIDSNSKPIIQLTGIRKTITNVFILCIMWTSTYFLFQDFSFEKRWKDLTILVPILKKQDVFIEYNNLFKSWNGNPLFLYNFAYELNSVGDYTNSTKILDNTIKYWNDYDIQLLLGDNYQNSKLWHEAEKHFILASNMCPDRFLPLFYLQEIYVRTGQSNKAISMAKFIIARDVKIPSPTVTLIKSKMQTYINTRTTFQ